MTSIQEQVLTIAQSAKKASRIVGRLSTEKKNKALCRMAEALIADAARLKEENSKDVSLAQKSALSSALIDRLLITDKTITEMASGLREVANLPDPVGEVTGMWRRPNNILVGRRRIPLGVIGIIYEARPNVTADAAGLCLKSGNAVILRGGSEAISSNRAMGRVLQEAMEQAGIPPAAVQVVPLVGGGGGEEVPT